MLLLTYLHLRKLRSNQNKRRVWCCTASKWSWDPNPGRLVSELTLQTTRHTAKLCGMCLVLPWIMVPGVHVCLLHCIIPENCITCGCIFYSTQNHALFNLGISQTFVELRTQPLFPRGSTHHRDQRCLIKSNMRRRVGTLSIRSNKISGNDSPFRC